MPLFRPAALLAIGCFWRHTVETTTSAVVEDGTAIGYLSIQRDVTLQREAGRAAELARVAIEHAPDAVCWFDPAGRILYVNRMTLTLTGYDRSEIDHRSVVDFLPGIGVDEFHRRWQELLQTGGLQMRSDVLRRNGTRLPVDLRVTRVVFGEASYGCSLLRDISEH